MASASTPGLGSESVFPQQYPGISRVISSKGTYCAKPYPLLRRLSTDAVYPRSSGGIAAQRLWPTARPPDSDRRDSHADQGPWTTRSTRERHVDHTDRPQAASGSLATSLTCRFRGDRVFPHRGALGCETTGQRAHHAADLHPPGPTRDSRSTGLERQRSRKGHAPDPLRRLPARRGPQ